MELNLILKAVAGILGNLLKWENLSPVKAHGMKTTILPYALKGLIKKFGLPSDIFDRK